MSQTKITNVSGALNSLVEIMVSGGLSSKCIQLASKISSIESDKAKIWVETVIQDLINACKNQNAWFEKDRSVDFLFALNVQPNLLNEKKLRVIADFALSTYIPSNENQLMDHLRIAALFIQQFNQGRTVFLSGPMFLLRKVIWDRTSFGFFVSQKAMSASIKLFDELSTFECVQEMLPELCLNLEAKPMFGTILDRTNKASETRIESRKSKRVFPPIIRRIAPQIAYVSKTMTEDQKLTKELKKARREARKSEKQAGKLKMEEMRQAARERQERREKTRREAITILEAGRNDDLNMAAAPSKEQEEEDVSEEET